MKIRNSHHRHCLLFFILFSASQVHSTKTKQELIDIYKDSMDLTLCSSLFKLTRFFYESPLNILRTATEAGDDLSPLVTEDTLNDPNLICSGSGYFFTNKRKKQTSEIIVKIKHHFEWEDETESQLFSDKFQSFIECPDGQEICAKLLRMLTGNDLDLDIGHFHICDHSCINPEGAAQFVLLKYASSDLSKSQITLLL